jgi:hypothetical protein
MSTQLSPAEIDTILRKVPKDKILAKECKHATYSMHRDGENHDMLTIKEWVTVEIDGKVERFPTVRTKQDYERPYWLTKEHLRTHPDKIEFEDIENLEMIKVTQIMLKRDLVTRLKKGRANDPIKMIAQSPYVYGLDTSSEVFMKQAYQNRWPGQFEPNKVSVVDAETDVTCMLDKSAQLPILWSLVSDTEIVLYVNNDWAGDVYNYAEKVTEEYYDALPQWMLGIKKTLSNKKGEYPAWVDELEKLPLRVEMHSNHFDNTKAMVDRLHYTQPDIVTGWNAFFDFKVMALSAEYAGYDPADVLSDSRVPYEYRGALLREGQKVKKMSSGREMRLEPQERWNVFMNTASWKGQDAMQAYWQLRKAKGKESGGYGLAAVLERHMGASKLKYKTEDTTIPEGTLHWHMEMQRKYKVRYGNYNIFDSLSVKVQDMKNQDLSSQISALAGSLDYSSFNSQPKINVTDMLFSVAKKRKKIICSTSNSMRDDHDNLLSSKEGWIVTFPSHNVVDSGLFLFHDMPTIRSVIHMYGADADVETTYPRAEIIQNLSKETTMFEPCQVYGIDRETLRLASINLTGGRVNSIEIMESVCGWPTLDDMLAFANEEMTTVLEHAA